MLSSGNTLFIIDSYICHAQEFERKIKAWIPKIYLKTPAEREMKTTLFIAELNILTIMHETGPIGKPDFSLFRNAAFMQGIYDIFRPALMNPSIGVEWYRVERFANSNISRGPPPKASAKRPLDDGSAARPNPTKRPRTYASRTQVISKELEQNLSFTRPNKSSVARLKLLPDDGLLPQNRENLSYRTTILQTIQPTSTGANSKLKLVNRMKRKSHPI